MTTTYEPLARALAAAGGIAVLVVAAVNGMTDAPDWVTRYVLPIAGIVAAVGGGGAVARRHVWPDRKVQEFLVHAHATAPGPDALTPDVAEWADLPDTVPDVMGDDDGLTLEDIEGG